MTHPPQYQSSSTPHGRYPSIRCAPSVFVHFCFRAGTGSVDAFPLERFPVAHAPIALDAPVAKPTAALDLTPFRCAQPVRHAAWVRDSFGGVYNVGRHGFKDTPEFAAATTVSTDAPFGGGITFRRCFDPFFELFLVVHVTYPTSSTRAHAPYVSPWWRQS